MEEKDVCTRGKSCKLACIKTNLICREELKGNVQEGLARLVGLLPAQLRSFIPPPTQDSPATRTIEKGENFLKEFNPRVEPIVKKIDALSKELNYLESQMDRKGKIPSATEKELKNRFSKGLAELDRAHQEMTVVMGAIRSRMLSSSKVSEAQAGKIIANLDIHNAGGRKGEIKDQLTEFVKMFGGKGFSNEVDTPKRVNQLTTVFVSKDRAWANSGLGHMSTSGSKRDTFHEMAHFVEDQRPWLRGYTENWRNSRAWDKAKIKEMYGSPGKNPPIASSLKFKGKEIPTMPIAYLTRSDFYRKSETAVVDGFMHPYMGRVYKSGSTEVLSMAMEHFASPVGMARLRRAHPELFNLVVGLSVD